MDRAQKAQRLDARTPRSHLFVALERRANVSEGFGPWHRQRSHAQTIMDKTTRARRLPALETLAEAPLPTRFGRFQLRVYRWDDPAAHPALSKEHCALVLGDVRGRRNVPVRVHSECLTSEVFGSLKCDCREQLERAQSEIARQGFESCSTCARRAAASASPTRCALTPCRQRRGHHRGERAASSAGRRRGPTTSRRRCCASSGSNRSELLTNNPLKVDGLAELGIAIERRVPVRVPANPHSQSYLEVKRERMQHDLGAILLGGHAAEGDESAPDSTRRPIAL